MATIFRIYFELLLLNQNEKSKKAAIVGQSAQEKFKIDFQAGGGGGHLGFLMRIILAIFNL